MSKLIFKNILVLIKYLKYLIKALRIIRFQINIINGNIARFGPVLGSILGFEPKHHMTWSRDVKTDPTIEIFWIRNTQ